MKKVNLRDLYPDVYKTDAFLEVTDEVQAVFQSDERAEAAYLKAPVKRVTSLGVPVPFAPNLEDYILPKPEYIVHAVKAALEF